MDYGHSDLYKNSNQSLNKQEERRKILLEAQKKQRHEIIDANRPFRLINNVRKNKSNGNFNKNFTNKLQFSDWLIEKPEDIENWILVPCPKGIRCLIVAHNNATTAYNKRGYVLKKFRSGLPGDHLLPYSVTILDAIYVQKLNEFFILDVLSYGYQEMLKCEASFRFFWVQSKISELELNLRNTFNEIPINSLKTYDLANYDEILNCLNQFCMFNNQNILLDGLLFYHKEASYEEGVTPLVGWLESFMFEEVFGLKFANEYFNNKPKNYINYLEYIKYFNKKNQNKKNHSRKLINEMEILECENNEAQEMEFNS